MKAELYKLKKSSIHNVQTVMHLRVNTIPHKSTFSQANAAAICQYQMNGMLVNEALLF